MVEKMVSKEQLNKLQTLKSFLKKLGSAAIAFSGGVDSTFLLKVAHDELGENCIAVTAMSCSFPKRELEEARSFCKKEGIRHIIVESEELEIEGFCKNPKNRCYLCKRELFEKLGKLQRLKIWKLLQKVLIWMMRGTIALAYRLLQNLE